MAAALKAGAETKAPSRDAGTTSGRSISAPAPLLFKGTESTFADMTRRRARHRKAMSKTRVTATTPIGDFFENGLLPACNDRVRWVPGDQQLTTERFEMISTYREPASTSFMNLMSPSKYVA